tara:strand:+ start:1764 stop:2477 length:714 start_codon:yes stop_codon:yes gene_type:complete
MLKIRNKQNFSQYLDSVAKINDSAIFDIDTNGISCLVSSIDNTLVLYTEFKEEQDISRSINVPDLKKLHRVVDTIDESSFELNINNNNLEFRGKNVKFKYHLFEEGFLTKPGLNLQKIKDFDYDINFTVDKSLLQQLFKGSTFASETNKVYFYTEDGKLKAELTDRARHNTDVFAITIADEVDFTLEPLPVNFDNIRLLTSITSKYEFSINTEYGVVIVDNSNNTTKLKYIISSLTQ